MLNYNDDNEVIAVPEGWKKHVMKASPKKRSSLQSNNVSIDALPKSSAPKLASAKNVPVGTTSPFEFWKLFLLLWRLPRLDRRTKRAISTVYH